MKTNTTLTEIKANTTWIQGLGACAGKAASELVIGDILGWNGGNTSTVTAILKQTPTTVTIEEEWMGYDGQAKRGERTMKKSRIVATVENGKFRVANVTKAELSIVA